MTIRSDVTASTNPGQIFAVTRDVARRDSGIAYPAVRPRAREI